MLIKRLKARKLVEESKARKITLLERDRERVSGKIRINLAKFDEVCEQILRLENRKKELDKIINTQEQIKISIVCDINSIKCC